jgi:pimeloyl-ACP methyl ester carboxylesterase
VSEFSAALQAWRDAGRVFEFRDTPVFVREHGDASKPTLLLLHGFPTASWDWHKLWSELSVEFHLLAPDFVGYGFSAKPLRCWTIPEQADMVEALVESSATYPYHILAHDYGDSVAQELLAREGERSRRGERCIGSAMLLNGGLFPESHRPRPIQRLLAGRLGGLAVYALNRYLFERSFNRILGRDGQMKSESIAELYKLICHNDGKRRIPGLLGYLAERIAQRERWTAALTDSPVPLRLLIGGADPISGRHMADRFAELVPRGSIEILSAVGHYPQLEAPDRTLAAVRRFHSIVMPVAKTEAPPPAVQPVREKAASRRKSAVRKIAAKNLAEQMDSRAPRADALSNDSIVVDEPAVSGELFTPEKSVGTNPSATVEKAAGKTKRSRSRKRVAPST